MNDLTKYRKVDFDPDGNTRTLTLTKDVSRYCLTISSKDWGSFEIYVDKADLLDMLSAIEGDNND